jgi:glutamyl-tRNA synthetase
LIKIVGAPAQDVTLDLHPTNVKGGRDFKTAEEFYIEKTDLESFKEGNLYRLMDCLNFRKQGEKFVFDSMDYEAYKSVGKRIIHWLPAKEKLVDAEVLMPDATTMSCLAEPAIKHVKVDDVIQAERFGFMRLDKKEKGKDGKDKLSFWFTHQ